jgi:nitrate reductase beta subunit
MTRLLAKAFQMASRLPNRVQDQLAQELLEEIEWESRWDQNLANSQDKLDKMADKALQQYKAAKTKEMESDELDRLSRGV